MLIGRVTAGVVVVLATLWSTQGGKFGSIFEAINKIPMAFAPADITTIFLWGMFWTRGNRQGAMAALFFNVVIGLVYLAIDIPLIGTEQIIAKGLGIPFMQVGESLFLMCRPGAVYFAVSLMTPAPSKTQIDNLCWTRPLDALRGKMERNAVTFLACDGDDPHRHHGHSLYDPALGTRRTSECREAGTRQAARKRHRWEVIDGKTIS